MGKSQAVRLLGLQYQYFPFKEQMYALTALCRVLKLQVFFEQNPKVPNLHHWTIQAHNGRTLGRFDLYSKEFDLYSKEAAPC